ncbi:MAG: hypothetical protein KDA72_07895, partial [Planctomycetales bacterium]|nr:hypothetical protein [Planctomycetales bacterium]
ASIPQEQNGKLTRQFAYLPDFMATCVDLSGASYPSEIPPCVGDSLAPLLRGADQPVHAEPIYWEHEGNAAMRWGKWKLVREYEKPWELYDIDQDRTEMNNLATSHSAQRDDMVAKWEHWATEHEVAFPKRFDMYQWLKRLKEKQP